MKGLLKKHDAFENDFQVHRDRCMEIKQDGENLIADGNHNADQIVQRNNDLQEKLDSLVQAASRRKMGLIDNSAFLQFIWKTDVVESWIGTFK